MMRKTAIHIIAIILMLLSAVAAPARRTDGVKLLYWNIQNGMWDGQTDNYERFVEWVSARKPDICVWAEAQTIFKTGTNVKMAPEDRYLTDGWKKLAARYGQLPAGYNLAPADSECPPFHGRGSGHSRPAWCVLDENQG